MRTIIFFLIVFSSFNGLAQANWKTKFTTKKTFELGDSKKYEVSEFFKIDHLFFGTRSEVKTTVIFQVIDTINGGYWISYVVSTNSVKEHKDSSAYLLASLMDGIHLLFYAKNGYIQLDSTLYSQNKKRIETELDSISGLRSYAKTITQFIKYLKNELKNDAGLGIFLAPLIAFKTYYSSGAYSKFRIPADGKAESILNKPLFPGNIESEWKSTSKDSILLLNFTFTGHPVSSAQYYKSIYDPILDSNNVKRGRFFYPPEMRYILDYKFKIRPDDSFPRYIHRKTVSEYLFRSVDKMDMKEIPE